MLTEWPELKQLSSRERDVLDKILEDKKRKEKYVSEEDVPALREQIEERKALEAELKALKKQTPKKPAPKKPAAPKAVKTTAPKTAYTLGDALPYYLL